HEGDTIRYIHKYGRWEYTRQPDGTFRYVMPEGGTTFAIRIIDPSTVETFMPDKPANPQRRLVLRSDAAQPRNLEYGLYRREGYESQPGGVVFKHSGNIVHRGAPSSPVMDY